MAEADRTWLASVLFMDIVGYSLLPVDRQLSVKQDFNARVRAAVAGIDRDECITIDTGDGMALCYLGDPQPMFELSRCLCTDFQTSGYHVRLGLNLGPIRVVDDVNGYRNCVGEGINTAQRIMDFAAADQLLVSRTYLDVIARLADGYADLFESLGEHRDKHGRPHELYLFNATGAPAAPAADLDPLALQRIGERYARYVGRQQAADDLQSCQAGAASIADLVGALMDRLASTDDRYDFKQFLSYYGYGGY